MKSIAADFLRIIFLFLLSAVAQAQQDSIKNISLPEIEVSGDNIIPKKDGYIFFPTQSQRDHAGNGLDLLEQMKLPGVHIDFLEKSMTYTRGKGRIVMLVDNIESSMEDILSITPEQFTKVEYITMPGLKYGSNVAIVINVHTRKEDIGVALGVNTMNAITANYNDDGGWVKLFNKRSTLGVDYKFKLNDVTKAFTHKDEDLFFTNGMKLHRHREGRYSGGNYQLNDFSLSYNYTLPNRRVLDIRIGTVADRFPKRILNEQITGGENFLMQTITYSKELRTHMRLYYNEKITAKDQLTTSIAFAHLNNTYERGFHMPSMENLYNVNGIKHSLYGEVDYQHNFLNEQRFNIGYQQSVARTRNEYLSSSNYLLEINNNSQYIYAQYTGGFRYLYYSIGIGASREHFHQNSASHTFYSFRPRFFLQYKLGPLFQVMYSFERTSTLPSIAELTAFIHRIDNRFIAQGNPHLKPFNTDMHTLGLNFQRKGAIASLYGICEYSRNLISSNEVAEYNGVFWNTIGNGSHLRHYELGLYMGKSFFNEALNVYVEPKYSYDCVAGNLHNSNGIFSLQFGATAYCKQWSMNVYYRSANESLMGSYLTYYYPSSDFNIGYKHQNLSIKMGVRNIFSDGATTRTRRFSAFTPSTEIVGNKLFGNMIYLSLSWSLFKGHQINIHQMRNVNANIDAGIVK